VTRRLFQCWLLLTLGLTGMPALALMVQDEVTVGVFGMREHEVMEQRFQPLIDYLDAEIDAVRFRLEVLSPDKLDQAIRRNHVDLLLTNGSHYLTVRSEHTLSGVLATLVAYHEGMTTRSLGGVIITREDRQDIRGLADLAGLTVGSPGRAFLGGYAAPLYEADEAGIDLRAESRIRFLGTHDAVVRAVLAGDVDAGFVRSGVIESMRDRSDLSVDALRVVNRQSMGSYPFAVSTRLYPEWPMVTMPHVPDDLERRIAAALFALDTSDPASMLSGIAGFGPPSDYAPVESMKRALGLPPFDVRDEIAFSDVWAQYRLLILVAGIAVLLILALSLALLKRHVALGRSEERFRRFFQDNASIMLVFEPDDCRIVDANRAACDYYGYETHELVGRPGRDIWLSDCEPWRQRAVVDGVRIDPEVHTHRLGNGEERRVEVHGTHLRGEGGRERLFVIVHDITERERAERALKRERERLANVIEGTNVGTWEWNIQTGETVFNQRWAEMLGYDLAELEPTTIRTWQRFIHPDDKGAASRAVDASVQAGRAYHEVEVRARHRDGHWVWVLERGRVLEWTDNGQPLRMWGTQQDVTARKQMEQGLQLAASLFIHAREAILITDLDARIVDVNAAFTEMTGWRRDEVIGHTPRFLQSGLHDADFYRFMRERLRTAGYWTGELWNRNKNGALFAERLTISLVHDAAGRPSNYIALATDITDLKKYQGDLEHRANHDALTGLPNRVLMVDRLRRDMAVVRRHGGMLAVCFLDLDGFKDVNDEYGHDMGDKLLVAMAQDLGEQLRETDTLARISGDEFVVLLGGLTHETDARPIIDRLNEVAGEERLIDGKPIRVTASLGYTFYPQANGIDDETLIKQADSAMYEAKQGGRNRARRFRCD